MLLLLKEKKLTNAKRPKIHQSISVTETLRRHFNRYRLYDFRLRDEDVWRKKCRAKRKKARGRMLY